MHTTAWAGDGLGAPACRVWLVGLPGAGDPSRGLGGAEGEAGIWGAEGGGEEGGLQCVVVSDGGEGPERGGRLGRGCCGGLVRWEECMLVLS